MTNIDYTLWPNAGGTLGQIKVQIPTGTADDPWPTGDALVHNFVYQNGKLVGFVDTKALIANESKSTTFPYDYVNISLPSIAEGEITYNYDQCTYVVLNGEVLKGDVPTNDDLEEINNKYMGCKTVDDIKAIDPDYLTNDIIGGVWEESLADLTDGTAMFRNCTNLTSFSSDLSSLTDGGTMFYYCTNLTSFSSDLSSLTNGGSMFDNCTALTSFSSDLSSLNVGGAMFNGCTALTSFNSDLSSLTDGTAMFNNCKLNTASVQNIADTINTTTRTRFFVGIGNTTPNDQEIVAFNTIANKGWMVFVNGSMYTPTSPAAITTLDETGQEITTPIPFWAKPVPATEETAEYVDENGNFYNILGAQFIYGDDLSTYGMFTCEDDAAANMRLTKIVK